MNVLLVYPEYPDAFWSFRTALKFIGRRSSMPPLGLLTIASMLPKEWNLKLVDLNVEPLKDSHLEWADMVFVSAMLVQSKSAQVVIDRSKAFGKVVVAGGPVFANMSDRFHSIDHIVANEAELTLPRFLADFAKGCPQPEYRTAPKEFPNLTKTPLPMWKLINFKHYAFMLLQYSRGCHWDCDFCDITKMFGRVPRTKQEDQMIAEFQLLYDYGYRGTVFIVDDDFIGNAPAVKRMLRKFIVWQRERNYPFTLTTEADVKLADDHELMGLMQKANFSKVFVGIESVSVESLLACNKNQNAKRDLNEVVRIVQSYGMQVYGGFIVGLDAETPSVFDQQIEFIQQNGVVNAMVGLLQAIPGTKLWDRLAAAGRIVEEDSTGNNTGLTMNVIPEMDLKVVLAGYRRILTTIYSPGPYYARIRTFIRRYRPSAKSRLKPNEVGALIKSAWYIGIVSRKRWLYWWLLIHTSLTKARALPVAVELAIMGLHFEKCVATICQEEVAT